jgi:hypothetical protein
MAMRDIGLAIVACAALCGCGAAAVLDGVSRDLEAQAAALTVGAHPGEVTPLMDRPLSEIGRYARFGSAWHRYEFARRLEYGVGAPRDPVCAVYWYERAAQTPRPYGRTYATEPLGPGATGIWQAGIAVRRLAEKDDAARDAVDAARPGFGEAAHRCAALITEDARFSAPPSPNW